MKSTFKKSLGIICALALMLGVCIVPATTVSAATETVTVQKWVLDRDEPAAVTDGNSLSTKDDVIQAVTQQYYVDDGDVVEYRYNDNSSHLQRIKSQYGWNPYNNNFDYLMAWIGMNYKLAYSISANKEYTFSVNVYSSRGYTEGGIMRLYYSNKAMTDTRTLPDGAQEITSVSANPISGDTSNLMTFSITSETEISAGSYLFIRFQSPYDYSWDQPVFEYYIGGAELTTQQEVDPNAPINGKLDENGQALMQKWSIDKDVLVSGDCAYALNEAGTYTIGNRPYWDEQVYTVNKETSNGMLTISTTNTTGYYPQIRLSYQLNTALEAGTKYTLSINAYDLRTTGVAWTDGGNVKLYITDGAAGGGGDADAVGDTPVATVSGYSPMPTGEDSNIVIPFTPESDIASGKWLVAYFRVAEKVSCEIGVKDAKLTRSITEKLYDFDFDMEGDRDLVTVNGNTLKDDNQGEFSSNNTGFGKQYYSLIVKLPGEVENDDGEMVDITLTENTAYTLNINAACSWTGGTISVYAFSDKPADAPADYYQEIDNAKLIAENIGTVNQVSSETFENTTAKDYTFTTAGTDIDYSVYKYLTVRLVPDRMDWGVYSVIFDIGLYKNRKVVADYTVTPELQKTRYNAITLADNKFATYYLKDSNGEFQVMDSNILKELTPDTEYTFAVCYADDGRRVAMDTYGAEITYKTMKHGDVNADSSVDIRDLVNMKKAYSNNSTDDIYEIGGEGTSGNLVVMRQILLGMN